VAKKLGYRGTALYPGPIRYAMQCAKRIIISNGTKSRGMRSKPRPVEREANRSQWNAKRTGASGTRREPEPVEGEENRSQWKAKRTGTGGTRREPEPVDPEENRSKWNEM